MRPSDLPELRQPVAVDTETGGTHPDPPENARVTVVSIAWIEDDSGAIERHSFPFDHGTGKGAQASLDLWDDPNLPDAEWRALLDWLSRRWLVMHNAKFDLLMLGVGTRLEEGIDLEPRLAWDTMLASRILNPDRPADLAAIDARLASSPLTEAQRIEWVQMKKQRHWLDRMEWPRAETYAATDATVTIAAHREQVARFDAGESDPVGWRIERRLAADLLKMERRGVGYDVRTSLEAAQRIRQAEDRIALTLPFRPTVVQAKKYFFTRLGRAPGSRTPTGQPRLDEQDVTALVADNVPHAESWQRLVALKSARTKWYEPYATATGWDGRLRTVYSQAQVVSGRLASTRVNLQAIPHDYQIAGIVAEAGVPTVRSLFRARPGKRLVEFDLEQAELRVAARRAECKPMLELIEKGEDIHGAVATQLFGTHPGAPTWSHDRQIGKRADFAFIFGVGADTYQATLAKQANIWLSIDQCQSIVTRWRRIYPQFSRAINRYQERANDVGWITLANGRPRHFANYEDKHKAFNQWVQGSLAELTKEWLHETERVAPGSILLTVHDSLVLEIDESDDRTPGEVVVLGERLGRAQFDVPMKVDVKEWH